MATSFPLVIASAVFAVLALIAIVLSLSIPSWFVVQTDNLTTYFGSYQICTRERSGGASKECRRMDSQPFIAVGDSSSTATPCRRGGNELATRFGPLFGILIGAAVLSIVAAGLLLYTVLKVFQRRRRFVARASRNELRRNDPHYQPGDSSDDESEEDEAITSAGMIGEGSAQSVPEIVSAALMVVALLFVLASWVTYMITVKSWLYCDNDPCTYLGKNDEVTVCEASLSYVFAIVIFAWLAATVSAALLVSRFVLLKTCPTHITQAPNQQHPHQHQMTPARTAVVPPKGKQQRSADPTNGVATLAAPPPRLNASGGVMQPGEPEGVDLPEGRWEWDNNAGLFWSEEQQYFFDVESGEFYDPESELWYNPDTDQWHSV